MLTFFTTAKALIEHGEIVQRKAPKSWKLRDPDVELIVFGEDEGAAEVSSELGLVRRAVVVSSIWSGESPRPDIRARKDSRMCKGATSMKVSKAQLRRNLDLLMIYGQGATA